MPEPAPLRWIKTTLREVYGLFVDDSLFAVAIAAWLVLVDVLARLRAGGHWLALLLFAGLALILLESTWRYARKRR